MFTDSAMSAKSAEPQFNGITPVQQMLASCSGAILTSMIGKPGAVGSAGVLTGAPAASSDPVRYASSHTSRCGEDKTPSTEESFPERYAASLVVFFSFKM